MSKPFYLYPTTPGLLQVDASGLVTSTGSFGGGGTPASPSGSIQYNNGGVFGGSVNSLIDGTGELNLINVDGHDSNSSNLYLGINVAPHVGEFNYVNRFSAQPDGLYISAPYGFALNGGSNLAEIFIGNPMGAPNHWYDSNGVGMIWDGNGNVTFGANLASPGTTNFIVDSNNTLSLTFNGSDGAIFNSTDVANTVNKSLFFQASWLSFFGDTGDDGSPITFFLNNAEMVRYTTTGVGILTTTPAYPLDVNGTISGTTFLKTGGTSSQFLKADGSVDSSTYLPYVSKGTATLVSGTKAVTISGLTTSNQAFVTIAVTGGTLGAAYKAVCTTNTLTITSVTTAGVTVITDTSTLNYFVI